MKNVRFINSVIITAVLSLFLVSGLYAQDKKDDNCTDTKMKTETIKSAEVNQIDSTMPGDQTARLVDSKLTAWNAVCPVRGNKVDPKANKVEYKGKVYGFCCNGCDDKFINDPETYLKNLSNDGKTFLGKK
jgi:YHS domain-containing protein